MSAVLAPNRLARVLERVHSDIQILPWSPEWCEQAMPIMREMHQHSIYADMPLDEAKTIHQLAGSGLVYADRFFRIAVLRGEGLGAFYGCVQRTFFNNMLVAYDMGWWVKKDARGSMAAPLLLDAFEKWAKSMGAVKSCIAQSTAENIETTTKLFEACGYRLTGMNTVKDL